MLNYISSLPSSTWEFPRRLCLLGSTGSIGRNAMRVLSIYPELFSIYALAAGRNTRLLAQQAYNWRPKYLAVQDEDAAKDLHNRLDILHKEYSPEILIGESGYTQIASLPEVSGVLSAQMGAAALPGTLAAAKAGKVLCLANKESLVLAGSLLRKACAESGATILPVDSEHNAIFQALLHRAPETVRSLILTASGGPFRGMSREDIKNVTKEQALQHPNWNMGAKITIDSATMMNKGLELIEAWQLYNLPPESLAVLVHPQSIIHSLVEFNDGSQIAQLAVPDMRLPLAYCLAWPRILDIGAEDLHLSKIQTLTFEAPDINSFPCLKLAKDVLKQQKSDQPSSAAVVLNAANEIAVDAFLQDKIGFLDIADYIAQALDANTASDPTNLEEIEELDHQTRQKVQATIG